MESNYTANSNFCNVVKPPLPLLRLITGTYMFPPLFAIGVIGNTLNLCVLNSRGMRTKTNLFLSAMALSDICFLICTLILEMVTFNGLRNSHSFMTFYINSRMTFIAMCNWFSAASIWIAVLVTVERVVAIKAPLKAKFWWKKHKIALALITIYMVSFVAQVYNIFWAKPLIIPICKNVYQYGLLFVNETVAPRTNTYIQISLVITPIMIVAVPTILLIVLNSCLLYYLFENRRNMAYSSKTPQQQGNEQRVACTVSVIVLSFILCTSPSAILITYNAIEQKKLKNSQMYQEAAMIANLLVIIGKAMNFILYCSSSRHFRRRLKLLFCRHFQQAGGMDSVSNYISPTQRRRSTVISVTDTAALKNNVHGSVMDWLVNTLTFRPRSSTAVETRLINEDSLDRRQQFQQNGKLKTVDYGKLITEDPYHSDNLYQKKRVKFTKSTDRRYTHPTESPDLLLEKVLEVRQRQKLSKSQLDNDEETV